MATLAESQAQQAWPLLTSLAAEGERSATYLYWPGRITYTELAEKLGTHERGLVPMLDLIMSHCRSSGLPPLTGVVTLKETGVPGDGFPLELMPRIPDVFTFNWTTLENPFEIARPQ